MAADKEFADKVREIIAEYTTAFKAFGDDVIAAVKFEMEKGMDIRDAVQKVLEDLDFDSHNTELIAAAVVASAIAGFGLRPEQVTAEAKAEIKKVLMKKPWSVDGMKLSERLHGVDKVLRQNIISTVTASVNNSDSVIDMARKLYDGYNSGKAVIKPADLPEYLKKLVRQARLAVQGDASELSKLGVLQAAQKLKNPDRLTTKALKRAYKDLVEACAKLETEAVDKALWTAVQEKSRYYAERIARTESARAWYEGYMADSDSDDDVAGFKYTLSSAHKRKPYDICDVYANADFGFGKGIWPKGRQPEIPVHPHCMCYYGKVFKWQLKGEWKPEKAREYINSRSAVQKQLLFGKEGTARYNAGEDWQKLVHKTKPAVVRLGADDFTSKAFSGKISEPVYVDKVALDKVDETLEKYEKEMVKLDHETAIIITKEGKVFSVVGEEGSVYFRNVGEDALNGATVTHNHPAKLTRYSFSKYDLKEFMDLKLHRLRGIDDKFVYEIIANDNTSFIKGDEMLFEYNNSGRMELLDKRFRGEASLDDDEEFHEINKILAGIYNYTYRRMPRE